MAVEAPRAGSLVGRYVVIDQLGVGGMGIVVRAYDPKLQREVALKILKTHAMTEEATERLVREARAMAKLNHPNVVAVYDVELDDEQGTIVAMEYVAGRTLKDWARYAEPSLQERVQAFVQAGRGLAEAHAAGLLHRDFKPDNVLVGEDGRVRVTDFGLARIDAGGRDPSSRGDVPPLKIEHGLTAFGTVLGTPRYMAPEQHGTSELTPAADQFAFCVSCWEVLTWKLPYVASDLEGLVVAKHQGPPPWPKDVDLPRIVVDAIRRGLTPDPEARWRGMPELLDRLEAGYAHRRRNRMALAGLGGVLVMTSTAAVLWPADSEPPCRGAREQLSDAWSDARREAVEHAIVGTELAYAATTWAMIEPALTEYADAWVEQHTEACRATRVRGEQSPEMLDARVACLHNARRELEATTTLLAEADDQVVERAREMVAALPSLAPCADLDHLRARVPPPPRELESAVADVRDAVAQGRSLRNAGKYKQSQTTLKEAVALANAVTYPPVRTEAVLEAAYAHQRLGEYDEAMAGFSDALQRALEHGQFDEASSAATSLMTTAATFLDAPKRALDFAIAARGLATRTSQPMLSEAEFHRAMGSTLENLADYPAAIAEHRTALKLVLAAPDHDALDEAAMLHSLGVSLKHAGELDEAQASWQRVVEIRSELLGEDHPRTANARHNLAGLYALLGDVERANTEYERALAIYEVVLGPDHPTVAGARSNRAGVLEELGRADEAFAEYEAALKIMERAYGPDHIHVAMARLNVAARLGGRGDREGAVAQLKTVIASVVAQSGERSPVVAAARVNLGLEYQDMRRLDEAAEEIRKALAIQLELTDEGTIQVAEMKLKLALVLVDAEKFAEARPYAEAAWAIYGTGVGETDNRAESASALAEALAGTGDPDAARPLAEEAITLFQSIEQRDIAEQLRAWVQALPPAKQ